mgnify:CR=1 FL=1
MRWSYIIPLIIILLSLLGCAQPLPSPPPAAPTPKPPPLEESKQIIKIKAEGEILHYQKASFWNEKAFSEILESKQEFESKEIDTFKKNLKKYNKHIINPKVEFDEARKSTILISDIKGAMYSTDSYDFHWLLGDLPFDLYQFKQSEKELNYEGEVNGVPTTIRLIFPYTIAHCHEHVWPAK